MILLEVSLATAPKLPRIPPRPLNSYRSNLSTCHSLSLPSGVHPVIQEDHNVNQCIYRILDSAAVVALFGI